LITTGVIGGLARAPVGRRSSAAGATLISRLSSHPFSPRFTMTRIGQFLSRNHDLT
jgi:hypothetical protein